MVTAHRRIVPTAIFCCAAMTLTGCKAYSERGAKGVGLLPKPTSAELHLSKYQPKNPYSQLAPGLLSRKLFETTGPKGSRIEINDLLVGPKQHSASVTFPGLAICEVKSGQGTMKVGSNDQKLELGTTFTIPKETPVAIENATEVPLAIQVHMIRAE